MKKRFAASAMILAMSAASVLSPLTAFADAEEQELNIAVVVHLLRQLLPDGGHCLGLVVPQGPVRPLRPWLSVEINFT